MMALRSLYRVGVVMLFACVALGCDRGWADDRGDPFMSPGTSPARDAHDLALLAPPSRRSTADASYGDAPLTRSLSVNRKYRPKRQPPGATAPVGVYLCRDRVGPTDNGLCARDPRRVGFRQFYLYTPSYATSPQVTRGPVNTNPVLPPATGFFYSANSFLFGKSTDE